MANPAKPVIDYSYTGFQQEQQENPFPGTQLDNDLAELKRGVEATIDALADVRRADGALPNGKVTLDSLSPDVKTLFDESGIPVGAGVVTLASFGVVGDGTDETTKIQTAFDTAAANGWVLNVGRGTFHHTGLSLPSNLTVRGVSRWHSKFQKIAGNVSATLIGTNKINLDIQGVGFFGNGQGAGNDIAISLTLTSDLAEASKRFVIRGCYFEGFRAQGWITIYNRHPSLAFENIDISDNTWISTAASIWAGAATTLGIPCAMVSIANDLSVPTSRITSVRVQDNFAYGVFVKQFYASWYGLHDIKISGNVILGVGTDSTIQDFVGAYAIMVYDSSIGNSPTDVAVSLNSIIGVRSIGIYCAGATKVRALGNLITGQTDTTVSLPSSAIAMGACWDWIVQGNEMHDIAATAVVVSSVPIVGSKTDLRQSGFVTDNLIVSATNGIRVNGVIASIFPSDNEAFGIGVSGNRIYECLSGVIVQTFGATIRDLAITGNQVISSVPGSYGIRGVGFGGTPVLEVADAVIAGNTIKAAAYGINWTRANVGSTTIRGNDIYGPVTVRGLEFPATTGITLIDNTFHDFTSGGGCMRSSTAEGVMQGTTFVNCATAFTTDSAADMGRAVPTWAPANREDFVQGINQVETGVGDRYIIMGWRYGDGVWRECRAMTGNKSNQYTAIATDAGAAFSYLIATHGKTVVLNAAITADRAVALGTTSAVAGDTVRFVRSVAAAGAFNWNIGTGPLKAISAAGDWADFTYNGTAWVLSASS